MLRICNHRSRLAVAFLYAETCLHHIHRIPSWLCATCQPQTRHRLANTPTLSLLLLLLYVHKVLFLGYCTRAGGLQLVRFKRGVCQAVLASLKLRSLKP